MVRKNRIAIVIVLMIIVAFLQATIVKANYSLGYEKLMEDWQENNFQLKEIELNLSDASRALNQAKKDVATASSSWSNLVDILYSVGREITPIMKFGTVMQRSVGLVKAQKLYSQQELSAKTRQDGEYIRLREYYLDYWGLYTQMQIDEKKVEIAKLTRSKNNLLYKQDKLGELELKMSEINYLEEEQKMLESKRLFNEKQHLLNTYIGVDLDTYYEVGIWEEQKTLSYSHVDRFISKALEERFEIRLINDNIAINQLTIETYEKYFDYSSMNDNQRSSYDELKEDNITLNLQLVKMQTEIEKQLREIFLDINYEEANIKTLLNLRNDANSNYLKIKELYAKEKASKIELLQAETKYIEAKDAYLRSIYNYNTQVLKLNSLSGAGLNVEVNSGNNLQGGER